MISDPSLDTRYSWRPEGEGVWTGKGTGSQRSWRDWPADPCYHPLFNSLELPSTIDKETEYFISCFEEITEANEWSRGLPCYILKTR